MLHITVTDGIKAKGGNRANTIYVLVIRMPIAKLRSIKQCEVSNNRKNPFVLTNNPSTCNHSTFKLAKQFFHILQ